MGLDMWLKKAKKVTPEEAAKLNRKYIQEAIDSGMSIFGKNEVDAYPEMYKDLKDYMAEILVIERRVDHKQIKRENQIPESAHLWSGRGNADGTFTYSYSWDKENKSVTVDDKKYIYDTLAPVYIAKLEDIYYWRKAYDIEDYIYSNYHGTIENCGYYKLDPDVVEAVLAMKDSYGRGESGADYEDGEDIFYHEWY